MIGKLAHPLHALRKLRLFRALSRRFDPMVPWRLPPLAHPIYLRLLSHAAQIFKAPVREASIHEIFAAVLGALPQDKRGAFWDIGANNGWFTWQCATLRPDFEIVSFEPDPKNVRCLERTSQRWNLSGLTIVPSAVAERTARAPFFIDDIAGSTGSLERTQSFNLHHYGHRAPQIEVDTIALDDFSAARATPPSVIKIDVEGAELRVLQGASGLLREYRPILFYESFNHRAETRALLDSYGYLVYDSDFRRAPVEETTNFIAVAPDRAAVVMSALTALGYPVASRRG
jgi:FkbM family methyltransferase